jgi:cytidylate kinase
VYKLIIAIDGPAASGKSTTAKLVAGRLGYAYLDSGAMYRAAALRALRLRVPMSDHDELATVAREASITFPEGGAGPVHLDGEDVTSAIRAPEVTDASSVMSSVPAVRRAMVRQQRMLGRSSDCVVEGRDIGTVVFPDAELKVFLVASIEERARRRVAELEQASVQVDPDQVIGEIRERDRRDSTRSDSPLRKAEDAIELDTTSLSIEEQVAAVVRLAVERGARDTGAEEERRSEE